LIKNQTEPRVSKKVGQERQEREKELKDFSFNSFAHFVFS